MLPEVTAVIGAHFGDEGKGLITDFLAAQSPVPALVVRFNGGAQAGHTVTRGAGERHVFSHVGSGSFAKADTYWSGYCATSPLHFSMEWEALKQAQLSPRVWVDPYSPVTTFYDMVINRILEEHRGHQGQGKHGSCGVGFGETLERQQCPEFRLSVSDLYQPMQDRLHQIRSNWLPSRLEQCGVPFSFWSRWQEWIDSDDLFQQFLQDIESFRKSVSLATSEKILEYSHVIFEGAQGLRLDQAKGYFPHVTRSYTGLTHVVALLEPLGIQQFTVIYVTRAYITRHGAGPLPYELPGLPFPKVEDATNRPNPYQDALRFAWFNLDLLESAIASDLSEVPPTMQVCPQLAITCLDQVEGDITYVENDRLHTKTRASFLEHVKKRLKFASLLCSFGPRREDVCIQD